MFWEYLAISHSIDQSTLGLPQVKAVAISFINLQEYMI
jgi:hypothetical protein